MGRCMSEVDSGLEPPFIVEDAIPLHGHERPHEIPGVDILSDAELEELNGLLPWNAFVADSSGRRFGLATSATKRNKPGVVPDRRILELHRRFGLADKVILEIGCFEGIHTVALARLARKVIACDGRISNVAKTAVRCAMYQVSPTLFTWDVEKELPKGQSIDCDVLHHVGVLYHLVDPVTHLESLLPHVSRSLLLDTHYAAEAEAIQTFSAAGREFRFRPYREGGLSDPFSGMYRFARWLLLPDLMDILRSHGFAKLEAVERQERNGLRVAIYAER
jgi:SAM-dependent methyltransferase